MRAAVGHEQLKSVQHCSSRDEHWCAVLPAGMVSEHRCPWIMNAQQQHSCKLRGPGAGHAGRHILHEVGMLHVTASVQADILHECNFVTRGKYGPQRLSLSPAQAR